MISSVLSFLYVEKTSGFGEKFDGGWKRVSRAPVGQIAFNDVFAIIAANIENISAFRAHRWQQFNVFVLQGVLGCLALGQCRLRGLNELFGHSNSSIAASKTCSKRIPFARMGRS